MQLIFMIYLAFLEKSTRQQKYHLYYYYCLDSLFNIFVYVIAVHVFLAYSDYILLLQFVQ